MRYLFYLISTASTILVLSVYPVSMIDQQYHDFKVYRTTLNHWTDDVTNVSCRFQNNPVVIRSEQDLLLQYWIEAGSPVLAGFTLPDIPSLHEFRKSINRLMDTDPVTLLNNQRSQVSGGDAINVDLVLNGEAGTIRRMNCLEGLLLSVQAERSVSKGKSMYSDPTEFMSYVLARDDTLKIYFYTVDQPGIGGLSVFDELLDRDRAAGWKVSRNIHNHNFFPGSEMVLGGVVPSAADVGYFRNAADRYGLSGASITNGFHTIDLSPDDFRIFSTETPVNDG